MVELHVSCQAQAPQEIPRFRAKVFPLSYIDQALVGPHGHCCEHRRVECDHRVDGGSEFTGEPQEAVWVFLC